MSSSGGGSGAGGSAGAIEARVSLLALLDKKAAFALNTAAPWSADLASAAVVSDFGSPLVLHLPFTERVRLDSLSLAAAPGAPPPTVLKLFVNRTAFAFDDAAGTPVVSLAVPALPATFKLNPAKFAAVTALTICASAGEEAEAVGIAQLALAGSTLLAANVANIKKSEEE